MNDVPVELESLEVFLISLYRQNSYTKYTSLYIDLCILHDINIKKVHMLHVSL